MSVQELLDFGMVKNDHNPLFPFTKNLSGEIDDKDKIELSVYTGNNQHDFVLSLPEGGLLFLAVQNVKDLEFVEKLVLAYEPF